MKLQWPKIGYLLCCLGLSLGCRSLGPRTVTQDRFDYSSALADSWKSMMLLNIIKTRYLDLPMFLDVGQVVSSYTLEASASVGGNLNSVGAPAAVGNNLALGGAARYSQQPTVTYTPLTGDKFLEGFLIPVEPVRMLTLLQAGYAADFVLQLGLESLNGLRNDPVRLGSKHKADPEFFRVLALLRDIQEADAIGMRFDRPTNGTPATVLFFRGERVSPDIQAKIQEVRALLGLDATSSSFQLVQGPVRGRPGELAVGCRSVSQMMIALSLGVEVPPEHQQRKLAPPIPEPPSAESLLLVVHSGPKKPAHPYAAVSYEGQWFWIESNDWRSKRTFTSILFVFTLSDTGAAQSVPALTIPTR